MKTLFALLAGFVVFVLAFVALSWGVQIVLGLVSFSGQVRWGIQVGSCAVAFIAGAFTFSKIA